MRHLICALLILILSLCCVSAEDIWADVYFSCERDDKRIALTFDDGPHYKYTAEILDILAENDVHATFFVVGSLAEKYPELVLRELSEGHEIASHTWSHPHLNMISKSALENELTVTEEFLYELAEYRPRLFRPPEGKCPENVLLVAGEMDYEIILWTVDTLDWAHTPSDAIVENVLTNTDSGSIILCHDFVGGVSPTPNALRKFIPELKRNGYKFVTVSELLYDD